MSYRDEEADDMSVMILADNDEVDCVIKLDHYS